MRKLRILALMHADLVPPEDVTGVDLTSAQWRTEHDVVDTLRQIGHEVRALGVRNDLGVIRQAIEEWKPHIAFNLLEEFDGVAVYDQNVVSYLELLKVPYTGCNPRGLMLARDKALSKKILHYHRIPSPDFMVVPMGRPVRRPRHLEFPLIVKSLSEEASLGISQASIVEDDERLRERVGFVHNSVGTGAIAERYIEGRELYVSVLGNRHLQVFPVWELVMDNLPDEARRIATQRVKWSRKYQDKYRITSREARNLPEGMAERLRHLARRVFRILGLNGYARIDLRMDRQNRVYVIEANPNPQVARGEDFADSAEHAGVPYRALLQRLIAAGLRWRPAEWGR
ncbi:MAG: ATP-grasp domain-containing protein [Gammaproteobacteria bacterium]|nr:ATP-grasp domain-containing protein [Gammaproteobacteria bacterium]MCG3144373.1 D-alanine--D-alanine ligase [Gammaproteobacteria bacterium]